MGQGTVYVKYPAATVQPIVIARDADTTLSFVLLDEQGNHPVDLSADTVKFTVADGYGGTVKIGPLTNLNNQHTDPTNGKTSFTISKATINAVASSSAEQSWLYEVRRLTGGSTPEVVHLTGEFRVRPSVYPT